MPPIYTIYNQLRNNLAYISIIGKLLFLVQIINKLETTNISVVIVENAANKLN